MKALDLRTVWLPIQSQKLMMTDQKEQAKTAYGNNEMRKLDFFCFRPVLDSSSVKFKPSENAAQAFSRVGSIHGVSEVKSS